MALNQEIITREEGQGIIDAVNGVKNAIVSQGVKDVSALTYGQIQTAVRLGSLDLFSLGDEMKASSNPTISTFQGTLTDGGTAGVTGATVTSATFIAKVGTASGASVKFVYDGTNWHLDTIAGTIATLSEYGVVVAGTPKTNDYVTISEATSTEVFQVVNKDATNKVLTIMAKDCIEDGQQFLTPPQLTFANNKAILPVGKYKFTCYKAECDGAQDYDGTFVFTTTVAIPLGGGFLHSKIGLNKTWGGGTTTDATAGTISTYAADHSTVLESGLAVTAYDSSNDSAAVDLGTISYEYVSGKTNYCDFGYFNWSRRVFYGSGDYATSIIRQWLNASANGGWWVKKSIFDIKPANGWTDQRAGYMYAFDSGLLGAIKKSKRSYYMHDSDYSLMNALSLTKPVQFIDDPSVTVNGRIITVEDYFYLPSIVELGFGAQWSDNLAGNTVFGLFDGATNADRIKYFNSAAKYYWLRSSSPWSCYFAAGVTPSGTLDYDNAYDGLAVVPACDIG